MPKDLIRVLTDMGREAEAAQYVKRIKDMNLKKPTGIMISYILGPYKKKYPELFSKESKIEKPANDDAAASSGAESDE